MTFKKVYFYAIILAMGYKIARLIQFKYHYNFELTYKMCTGTGIWIQLKQISI